MSTTIEMKDSIYGELLAQSLPRPIHTKSEHDRLTQLLLSLDEREDLSPKCLLCSLKITRKNSILCLPYRQVNRCIL